MWSCVGMCIQLIGGSICCCAYTTYMNHQLHEIISSGLKFEHLVLKTASSFQQKPLCRVIIRNLEFVFAVSWKQEMKLFQATLLLHPWIWVVGSFLGNYLSTLNKLKYHTNLIWEESCVSSDVLHFSAHRWLTSLSKQVASSHSTIFVQTNSGDGVMGTPACFLIFWEQYNQ
jgi:hypothetical protein